MGRGTVLLLSLGACSLAAAAPYAVTVTVSPSVPQAFSTNVGGVNVGHAFDPSWAVYMKRLGVNGAHATRVFVIVVIFYLMLLQDVVCDLRLCTERAGARMFGGNGGVAPVTTSPTWGQDHNGVAVTSQAAYLAAQSTMRTRSGHDSTNGAKYSNPPNYAAYDAGLSTPDPTKPSGQSVLAQVTALQSYGIEPVVVDWNTVRRTACVSHRALLRISCRQTASPSKRPRLAEVITASAPVAQRHAACSDDAIGVLWDPPDVFCRIPFMN